VAPGALWIGVKVLSGSGSGYDSWIHAGFEWLLAPGGDPARAPDVVNCSWGSEDGFLTTFQSDVQALRAAGILPVFSVGNAGPQPQTVGSPASLPEAFAVGATDAFDEVASFSSRGPSPWGEVRPHVSAPGVNVRSSLPGGRYGLSDGTSMATPHVSGLVALLLSADPSADISRAMSVITATAVTLGTPIPNNDSGWGRVDAFAAVASVLQPGFVSGTVTGAATGEPIPGAAVVASSRVGGGGGSAMADADGRYVLTLAPSIYDLYVSAFGYQPSEVAGVSVITDEVTVEDFALTLLPAGTVYGRITEAETGLPISATVAVLDTPLRTVAADYSFTLPTGVYTLQAERLGYRVVTGTAVISAGEAVAVDMALPPAPTILLVDSGSWYYRSQIATYRQALDDLAFAYDEWSIRHLPDDVPVGSDLVPYDVVVWSAPQDAPGFIGAHQALSDYLTSGGHLFLSGQDVGYLDGHFSFYRYYRDLLKARFVADDAGVHTLTGVPDGIFAGQTITIAGSGGADNQGFPDVVAVADPDCAEPTFTYQGDGSGGLQIGTCLDYRALYLSFGFEAISDRAARAEVMDRALAWLVATPPPVGLELTSPSEVQIGQPGHVVTHTVRLRHLGQTGVTDTFMLSIGENSWPTGLAVSSIELAPCASATAVVSVTIPPTAGWDARDLVSLAASPSLSPTAVASIALVTKSPAPILLVDDDRWFEQQEKYEAALTEAGFAYDVHRICPATGACSDDSPSPALLRWYPVVIWWTGYDWFRPVTAAEEASLEAYLLGGGRLFLSSQDFLYYHHLDPFTARFLGVLDYTESVTPTLVRGVPEDPVGEGHGPYTLDFPFSNWSDGVDPTPGTSVAFRDQNRRGIGLSRREGDHAALFMSFPFEALPEPSRPDVMASSVGWLSWLGSSAFGADRGAVAAGRAVTYTLRVRNDGPTTVTASVSNTLPAGLTLAPGSLTGPADYDPSDRRVWWQGPLAASGAVTMTYRAAVAGSYQGPAVTNTVELGLEEQSIHFDRRSVVRVDGPDLGPSALRFSPTQVRPGGAITSVLVLANSGPADAPSATAVISPPLGIGRLVSGSLTWAGGGLAEELSGTVQWTGPLSAGGRVSVSYQLVMPDTLAERSFYSVAFLADGMGGTWERSAWATALPRRLFLPVVRSEG
jgi:uncharacterized repeat protein (TIGR01451 family)